MKEKPDIETMALDKRQEDLVNLVGSSGWKEVRKSFEEKILQLQNINAVEGKNATEKVRSLEVNKRASEALFEIIAEIEGTAAMYQVVNKIVEKPYIYRE